MSKVLSGAWVVIAAYNEAGVLRRVVNEVRESGLPIVVVDDGSRDHTSPEALAGGAIVLRHTVNLGQGAALQTGIDYALENGAEYVYTFDADGQHSPEDLAVMANILRNTGAEIVLGSRWLGKVEGIPRRRRLMLKAAVVFTRLRDGLQVTDAHNGLRLFTRKAALRIRITEPRMAHASQILTEIARSGLKFAEAPVTIRYTDYSLEKGQKISGLFHVLFDLFYANWSK